MRDCARKGLAEPGQDSQLKEKCKKSRLLTDSQVTDITTVIVFHINQHTGTNLSDTLKVQVVANEDRGNGLPLHLCILKRRM